MQMTSRANYSDDALYRLLVQGVVDYAIYMLDPTGIVSNWNLGAQRAKGYAAEEIIGQHFSCFYSAADRTAGLPEKALSTALAQGTFKGEGWRHRKDGSRFWAQVVIDPIRDEGGALIGFAKITRDLTDKKRQDDQVRELTANLNLALSSMSQGLCLFNKDEELVIYNDSFRDMFNVEAVNLKPGTKIHAVMAAINATAESGSSDNDALITSGDRLIALSPAQGALVEEIGWNGRTFSVNHRALPTGGWLSTWDDVSERRLIEDRITHLANHDTLTRLPNRAAFQHQLDDVCGSSTARCFAMLYLDLDRFKPVNDTLGHPVGDAVLQVVARRIQAQLRKNDFAGRLGGDEFAVILLNCNDQRDASALADRLIMEISKPIEVRGLNVIVGASIGIAQAPQHGAEPELLLRNADLALYRAKESGRGCHRFYEAGMELIVQRRRDLERDLRAALTQKEFALHYQPVIDTARDRITSFEALLRWKSPTRGNVSPVDFIPFAEEIGLMVDIGNWVLRTACNTAVTWPDDVKVSVNLSPTQFRLPNLVQSIADILRETGLVPQRLELEITETAMIDDVFGATVILQQLRKLGVEIAMDDFGTGYSSLSFLHTLPFTRIKIDRSFVQELGSRPEAVAIVRAVTGLCSSLGVAATAEGVETEAQMDILRSEGCNEVQGFLISRPVAADAVQDWIVDFSNQNQSHAEAAHGCDPLLVATRGSAPAAMDRCWETASSLS